MKFLRRLLAVASIGLASAAVGQEVSLADLATANASSAAIIRNSAQTHLFRVEGTGRFALGGTTSDLGEYKMHVTVTGPDWTFLRLKATGSPALAGVVFDRGTTGFYQGLDNYGSFRVGPMATMDQTGLTNAKDQYNGLTLDPNGNGAFGIIPANIGQYRMALTVSGPKWPYLRLRGHNGGNPDDPFLTGIILDRGESAASTGFFVGFNNTGALRVAPITTLAAESGITTAKDSAIGMTMAANGDVTFSGTVQGANIKAQYQDVAEWVPSRADLDAGTVVVLDRVDTNTVLASTASYDTTVAGVVSAQPGIILGEGGAGQEQIATTGRVRVKVDASSTPIAIGDLLVTSDRPGFAMKSIPIDVAGVAMHRPGTIVGKALEPLAGGTGEILVLLSLQ